eukprot:Colp12_sorted_trinity150504_noHs@30177
MSAIINSLNASLPRWTKKGSVFLKPSASLLRPNFKLVVFDVQTMAPANFLTFLCFPRTPPALCGSNPAPNNYIVPVGDQVAARTSQPGEEQVDWILATVVRYLPGQYKYEVEDIMEDDSSTGKKKYLLPSRAIIPLPKWEADPSQGPFFNIGDTVLALYPQTTCFYAASVVDVPKYNKAGQLMGYLLNFVDDEDPNGKIPDREVSQRFVIVTKKSKK